MLKINLLPPELRKKKKKRVVVFEATQTLMILIIACEIIAFLSLFVFINVKVGNKQSELKRIRSEIDRLQIEVSKVRSLEEDARRLEKRVQIIDQLMFSRLSWARNLNELSGLIPDNIWLTSLSLNRGEVPLPGGGSSTKNILMLRGKVIALPGEKAVDLVGVFMNNLKFRSESFSDIEFMGTVNEKIGTQDVVGFDLRCPFR